MQLELNLTDAPTTVTHRESVARSRAAKVDAYRACDTSTHRLVLDCLTSHPLGLTRHEIAELTGLPLSSVCGRVNELLNEDRPKLYVSDERREKRSVLKSRLS